MTDSRKLRVGVIFGGRSGEHEVSLASARNVMEALQQAGHQVACIGITREGRWITAEDPMAQLTAAVAGQIAQRPDLPVEQRLPETQNAETSAQWGLLPKQADQEQLATIDVIFPVLHGPFGEDGTVQGMLEMANLPYVGCGVLASAVAMDKAVAKQLFAAANLPQTAHRVVMRSAWQADRESTLDALDSNLSGTLFVKPANMGSSVGVSKATDRKSLTDALDRACRYDRKLIVEEAVPHAREIEVSVLGNVGSPAHTPIVSVPGEIVPGNEFYDYSAKYEDDTSQLLIPAPLTEQQTDAVQEMALRAFEAIDGTGLARVDFLLNDENGRFYLNEVNTMPGFTQISMYPKLWEASGINYPDLVDRLVRLALDHHTDRQQNSTMR